VGLWIPDADSLSTFASHYMMEGGGIPTLQRIMEHSSITMTMLYAHLSPEHLTSDLHFLPVAQIEYSILDI